MVFWLLLLKLSLIVAVVAVVGLVLPQPLWAPLYSKILLGLGVVVLVVSAAVVLRRFLKGAA